MNQLLSQRLVDWFEARVAQVNSETIARHIFFLIATLIAVMLVGYHYGSFDQAVHIPFLAKAGYPELFPNDPFLDMRFRVYSYFWNIFLPFQSLHVLEYAMLVTHLVFTYCTFWAIWDLSQTLFQNGLTSVVAVLAFIVPHITFGGFPIIEFSVLNRTAVLPFLIWGMVLYLRQRTTWMFLLVGLLSNFHILSTVFFLAMVGIDMLRQRKWRALLIGGVTYLFAASPILYWYLSDTHTGGLTTNVEWFQAVTGAVLSNLFYLFSPQPFILFVTLSGFSSIVLFFIARRHVVSQHNESIMTFVVVALAIIVIQIISVLYPITLLMQLQIVRAGIPATIFAQIYFAHYLLTHVRSRILTATLILSPSALFVFIIWAIRSLNPNPKRFDIVVGWVIGSVFALFLIAGWITQLWQPGVYVMGETGDWRDAQEWARSNSPVDAVFITPPYKMGFYTADWRAFSRRGTVANLSDMLEVAIVPSGLSPWQERFESVAPGAQAQFRGDFFENVEITKRAYESLTLSQVMQVAEQYGASYIVVEKSTSFPLPTAYENDTYTIYQVIR